MNPDHLVELAEQIASIGAGYPKQVSLNRAVSTAYYALFHALAHMCVDRTVRRPKSTQHWQIVTPIYRSIEHAAARKVFAGLAKDGAAPEALKQVSRAFVDLQEARIEADYNPAPDKRCTRNEALELIRRARSAIEMLRTLPSDEQTLLAVKLVAKQR